MAQTVGDHAVKGHLAVTGNTKLNKGLDSSYLEIIDQKASNVAGGTFTGTPGTGNAWRSRDFTNVVFNDFATAVTSGAEDLLGANPAPVAGAGGKVTLEKGVYHCDITAPAFSVNKHVARLADITDGTPGTTVVLGTTEFSADTALWVDTTADPSQTRSNVTGQFQLTSQRVLEVQHWGQKTQATNGFGTAGSFYEINNVFTVVKMWMVRDDT